MTLRAWHETRRQQTTLMAHDARPESTDGAYLRGYLTALEDLQQYADGLACWELPADAFTAADRP